MHHLGRVWYKGFTIKNTSQQRKIMEICVECLDGEKRTVEVGVDDTTTDIRRKVATAAGLCEDGFALSFGGKVLAEGDDTTQLSAGDTVVLTKTKSQKDDAIAALRDLGETRLTAEKFKGLADPKLIYLFLQAEVVTEIPSNYSGGGTFEELDLSGVSGVTAIRDNFLLECSALHTADLSGWRNVTHIGNCLLSFCTALRNLDLRGWSNVTQIGTAFLSNCTGLTTLDLSGWSNVTQVDNCFLSDCSALTALHFSGWNNVTHIHNCFLANCSALTAVDFSGWRNVSHIGSYFLAGCKALKALDLRGWSNVTQIGAAFLSNCTALTTLDLSGWDSLTHIEAAFLSGCIALRQLDLSGWRSVTVIGRDFFKGCKIGKKRINITGSSSVVSNYVCHSTDTKRKCVCM